MWRPSRPTATNPWRSTLFIATLALLLFLTVSGAVSFLFPSAAFFIQLNVLLHTALGLLGGLLMIAFYMQHWRGYRGAKAERYQSFGYCRAGHVGGVAFVVSFVTGAALVLLGVSGRALLVYWAHIVVSVLAVGGLGYHVLHSAVERRARGAPTRIVRGGTLATVGLAALVALAAVLARGYRHETPDTVTRAEYELPHGDNPFAPSLPETPDMQFVNEAIMADSMGCGTSGCHEDVTEQWSESVHRYSADNPFFTAAEAYMVETDGKTATRYCGGCHDPLALLSGKMDVNGPVRNSHPDEGISCIACHGITEITTLEGTGAYRFEPPERYLFWDREGQLANAVNDLLIELKPGPHSEAFMPPLLEDPAFCSTCHKQYVDERTNDFRWLRLQDQYDSWQMSGFSGQAATAWHAEETKSCNDCHMRPEPSDDPGADDGTVRSHRYVAANTALPFLYGHDTQLEETERWLKNNEVLVDVFALRPADGGPTVAPLDSAAVELQPGRSYHLEVSVTNEIAHRFPTGPLDLYQAWLELIVTDRTGRRVFTSGLLDEDGFLDQATHQFMAPPIDEHGGWIRRHNLWDEHDVAFNHSIPAQATEVVRYTVAVPDDAQPPFTVASRLRYRRFNRWYTEWALGPTAPAFPIVDMSAHSIVLGFGGQRFAERDVPSYADGVGAGPGPSGALADDAVRFRRHGIGLLRQGDLARAEASFARAAALDPGWPAPVTDAALVALARDDSDAAAGWLSDALTVGPSDDRALAYLGIVHRRQGRHEDAIRVLSDVAERYPRDREVLLELARAHHALGQEAEAVAVLERVIALDPDEQRAHALIGTCYDALGQPDLARAARDNAERLRKVPASDAERAAFVDANPWAADEVKPIHEHGAASDAAGAGSNRRHSGGANAGPAFELVVPPPGGQVSGCVRFGWDRGLAGGGDRVTLHVQRPDDDRFRPVRCGGPGCTWQPDGRPGMYRWYVVTDGPGAGRSPVMAFEWLGGPCAVDTQVAMEDGA